MPTTKTDIDEILTKLVPVQGQIAWGISVGPGSFLTIEFGDPIPNPQVPAKKSGEWHLWISYAAWRLENQEEVLAGSEDSRSKLRAALQTIEGSHLLSVSMSSPALETTFAFEQGINLRVFPVYTEQDTEHWLLYIPDGHVLVIGPGANWSYKMGNLAR